MLHIKSDIKPIKQYGLQRSGTNYLAFLLEQNYYVDVWVNRGGWKHGPYTPINPEMHCIIISKNPFAWIVVCVYPIYNYPAHNCRYY